MSMRWLSLLSLLTACAAGTTATEPEAALGNRIRVRIEGRGKEPSITTADHFLFLMLDGPGGRRGEIRLLAMESAESEGMSLFLGKCIEARFDLPKLELVETLHGDPKRCEDVVLPAGWSLCLSPGTFYAYRIVDRGRTMVVERNAEIRLGAITADGSRYVEVESASGPQLERAKEPPGWPPRAGK